MKRILLTSTELMLLQFLKPHIDNLLGHGYELEIACSEVGGRFAEVQHLYKDVVVLHKVELYRDPFNPRNINGLKELNKIISIGNFDLIWTNEPVMGAMTRVAARQCRKKNLKVLYMVHGFHFYKGSSKINWLLFFPIEWSLSFCTDVLVTINKEDYHLSKKVMHAKQCEYIHGIGLDIEKFDSINIDRKKKRECIGIPENAVMLLSIGELDKRKNHEIVIKALGELKNTNIYYVICGKGRLDMYLRKLAERVKISERLILLGYRRDVGEICKCADIFVHPSKREGLGIAALEGMSAGLPLIASKINGILDYTEDGITGYTYKPDDIKGFANGIETLSENILKRKKMGVNAKRKAADFDVRISKDEVSHIIKMQIGD